MHIKLQNKKDKRIKNSPVLIRIWSNIGRKLKVQASTVSLSGCSCGSEYRIIRETAGKDTLMRRFTS